MRLIILVLLTGSTFGYSFFKKSKERSESLAAHEYMLEQLHRGNYDSIPVILSKTHQALAQYPENASLNADLGFVYLWQFSERGRKAPVPGIEKNVYLSNYYFKQAIKYNPDDPRLKGFQAATAICEGALEMDLKKISNGYVKAFNAIDDWPQFNKFAFSLVSSQLKKNSPVFRMAIKYQWELIDDCSCKNLNKKKVMRDPQKVFLDLIEELKESKDPLVKRACWNSELVPHNYEGYLLNFGDMLVKQGHFDEALQIYSAAKLSDSYNEWPYKDFLQQRINEMNINKKVFNKKPDFVIEPGDTQLFVNSTLSCVGCHQMSEKEFLISSAQKNVAN
ncbi:MAG: hypothetical protein K0S44_2542 [Bacteroidetes bacterium]|jgi:tetratricopeptide (TPR) repeat protein|nr:hypothetical protein [Bacteroidota bacterium]